jgi:hypothetical protein
MKTNSTDNTPSFLKAGLRKRANTTKNSPASHFGKSGWRIVKMHPTTVKVKPAYLMDNCPIKKQGWGRQPCFGFTVRACALVTSAFNQALTNA